ncbi:AbrB family transcriptional regulator [Marinobacterium aestuariivivens]|uniref:AbrB family transcriptional regulator n=1 Tax=Marinobacterium aestuariivivens TaxID=1698799 RepID=A0ABW2A5R0_9GAMM
MMLAGRTLLVGTLGALAAHWLSVPSSWLLGPVVGVTLAALLGLPVSMPRATTSAVSLFLGISVALNLDAGLVHQLGHWKHSVLLLCLMLVLLLTLLFRYYSRQPGWHSVEALFCSVPGNLAIMLSLAADTSADLRKVALVHSIRVCFLVTLLPLFLPIAERQLGVTAFQIVHPEHLLLVLILGLVIGTLLARCRVPAAMLFGGFAAALVVKQALGWEHGLPDSLMIALLIVLGSAIGARFNAVRLSQVLPEMRAALGGLLITLLICGLFAWGLWHFLGVPWVQAMLAYAPGGIEVMIAIAMNQQVDAVFVASHQIFRMIAMSMVVPMLLRRLSKG